MSDGDFEMYRQIAPETLDDASLKAIMKKSNYKRDTIMGVIENIWHDIPDQKAVGSDWVTTSKTKKATETQNSKSQRRDGGGRGGGGGRGRSMPPGGRGYEGRGGGPRSSSSGKRVPPSKTTSNTGTPAPKPADTENIQPTDVWSENVAVEDKIEEMAPPVSTDDKAKAFSAAPKMAWGAGANLAEKLKRQEAEKIQQSKPPKDGDKNNSQPQEGGSRGRVRGKRTRGGPSKKTADEPAAGPVTPEGTQAPASESPDAVAEIAASIEVMALETEAEVPPQEEELPQPQVEDSQPPVPESVESFSSVLTATQPLPTPTPVEAPRETPAPETIEAGTKPFLKLGKWETPIEPTEIGAFQFGSFASYDEPPATSNIPVIPTSTANAWGTTADESLAASDSNTNVWNGGSTATSAVGPSANTSIDVSSVPSGAAVGSSMTSLFPQSKGINGISSLDTASSVNVGLSSSVGVGSPMASQAGSAATRAPPGLEPSSSVLPNKNSNAGGTGGTGGNNRNAPGSIRYKSDNSQQQTLHGQQQLMQQQLYLQQQQQLPPGIPAAGRNSVGPNPNLSNLPAYGYTPFDLSQPQFLHPNYPQAATTVPAQLTGVTPTTGPNSNISTSTTTTAASTTPTAASIQPQQQYPSAPFPFYGNPYYPNQAFFYGQPQVANYYGQGRGVYQQRGPYGTDPYGNNASLYPGEVYQQGGAGGQFTDSSSTYGGMNLQGNNNSKTVKTTGVSSINSTSTGSQQQQQQGSGSSTVSGGLNQDHNSNYPYNPYNSRGLDAQAWQFQQNQAGAWAAPMMMASPSGAGGLPNQGFSQPGMPMQLQHQQQAGSLNQQGSRGVGSDGNSQQQRSTSNSYGNSFGNNRNSGSGVSGANTGSGVSQGSW